MFFSLHLPFKRLDEYVYRVTNISFFVLQYITEVQDMINLFYFTIYNSLVESPRRF